jgi:hypothetical protein
MQIYEIYMVIDSILYPPKSVANIFSNWFNGVEPRFKLVICGNDCSYLVALIM